jgi:monoamine oxidase
LNSAEYKLKG